jgi:3-deoxy-D-manno-octulosonic-acid transferase
MNAARALYSLVTWAVQPLLHRKLRRRAQVEPGYAVAVPERFGHYDATTLARRAAGDGHADAQGPAAPWVWIHAVSLGETRAAAILLTALRQQLPGMRLLLTHGTATGRAEGAKLLAAGDVQVWQPWDTVGAVRRFLTQLRPDIGILMETEVWPNLIAGCQEQGVPLVLANARLNAKSQRQAQRMAALARKAYAGLTAVWAQTDADAERLRSLGAPVQGVFGNLKFDVVPDAALLATGCQWRAHSLKPVVLLASSREGEEMLWLENFKPNQPDVGIEHTFIAINSEASVAVIATSQTAVQWLIVPRHPQRFDEVAALLHSAGLSVARRSALGTADSAMPDADVWLGDSLGEMALYYGLADVALLGGSFAPWGGQNLIEAAACGCPVVLGPHTFNFAEAAELACAAGAALRVADMGEGMAVGAGLACGADRLAQVQAKALGFAAAHRGGALATAQAVVGVLQSQPPLARKP